MADKAPVSREEMEEVREDNMEKETPETEVEEEETSSQDETSQEEIPEEKSKELQSALAQKDHWRKKAETAEGKLKSQKPETDKTPDEWRDRVEFLLKNGKANYSEEEFDHIANVSSRKDISLKDAAKQEDSYIQFNREKVVKEKGTPSSSSPASSVAGKTPDEIENMSDKEYSKFLEEDKKNYKSGGRGV